MYMVYYYGLSQRVYESLANHLNVDAFRSFVQQKNKFIATIARDGIVGANAIHEPFAD